MKYYQKGSIIKTSTTGSSALLIEDIHYTLSWSRIVRDPTEKMVSNIRRNKTFRERWLNLKL